MQEVLITLKNINGILWGPFGLISLLCGAGLFFTIHLKGIQFRFFVKGWKQLFGNFSFHGKAAGKDGMSSFQAVTTAIAAQVGTGSLVGAMTALVKGGPGAIFWMWVAAVFGMGTIFVEACLAQLFKTKDDTGQTVGGPAYYLSRGFKNKKIGGFLAAFFSIAIITDVCFMDMVQANSISDAFSNAFNIPGWITGIVLATSVAFILIGGIKSLASVTEKLVPFMAIGYICIGVFIVIINFMHIPSMFKIIFTAAFNPKAIWGGALGYGVSQAIRYGIARGLFSNEAGMGTTPHAHAVAKVEHPIQQGMVAIVSVFITTFIIVTITVFAVLSQSPEAPPTGEGIFLVQEAFTKALGSKAIGYGFIAICLFFFAFSTIIGWGYFAETNVRYLFGSKALWIYKTFIIIFVFLGCILKADILWEFTDLFNGVMAIPNLIGLIGLSGIITKLIKDYEQNRPFNVNDYIKN